MDLSPAAAAAVRVLTGLSLAGLLLAVGLRLRWDEVLAALRHRRVAWLLPLNFVVVPLLTLGLALALNLPSSVAVGMLLLAAAPFAPVVPVLARLAHADLALAAGLTGVMPFLSAFLTPAIAAVGLRAVPGAGSLEFSVPTILLVLAATITLPLAAGIAVNRWLAPLGARRLRPVDTCAGAAGLAALALVAVLEARTVVAIGWKPVLAMVIACEISMLLGYVSGGPSRASRQVAALGTANRNIALALLLALASFPESRVAAVVVANGMLMIALGFLHVAGWRVAGRRSAAAPERHASLPAAPRAGSRP